MRRASVAYLRCAGASHLCYRHHVSDTPVAPTRPRRSGRRRSCCCLIGTQQRNVGANHSGHRFEIGRQAKTDPRQPNKSSRALDWHSAQITDVQCVPFDLKEIGHTINLGAIAQGLQDLFRLHPRGRNEALTVGN